MGEGISQWWGRGVNEKIKNYEALYISHPPLCSEAWESGKCSWQRLKNVSHTHTHSSHPPGLHRPEETTEIPVTAHILLHLRVSAVFQATIPLFTFGVWHVIEITVRESKRQICGNLKYVSVRLHLFVSAPTLFIPSCHSLILSFHLPEPFHEVLMSYNPWKVHITSTLQVKRLKTNPVSLGAPTSLHWMNSLKLPVNCALQSIYVDETGLNNEVTVLMHHTQRQTWMFELHFSLSVVFVSWCLGVSVMSLKKFFIYFIFI